MLRVLLWIVPAAMLAIALAACSRGGGKGSAWRHPPGAGLTYCRSFDLELTNAASSDPGDGERTATLILEVTQSLRGGDPVVPPAGLLHRELQVRLDGERARLLNELRARL